MKNVSVIPIERKNKNSIRTVYLKDSTILNKLVLSDDSIYESVKGLLIDNIETSNYSSELYYIGHIKHDEVRHDCFLFDVTNLDIKTSLSKVKIDSLMRSESKSNNSLVLSLCFQAMSYLK